MKEQEKDKLKNLFRQIPINAPSYGFEEQLMQKVLYEAERKRKRRASYNLIYTGIAVTSGVVATILLPLLFFYLSGIETPELTVKFPKMNIGNIFLQLHFNPFIVSLPLVVLALLMCDTLVRRNIANKKNKS